MANFGNNVKLAFLKGLEAIGNGASNMASNAHQKLNEINLETRRRELMSELPVRALDLWQNGVELPEPLGGMLRELSELDEQLTVLRAQRYARVEVEQEPSEEAAQDEEEAVQNGDETAQDEGETALDENVQPGELPEEALADEQPPQEDAPACEAQEAVENAEGEAAAAEECWDNNPTF